MLFRSAIERARSLEASQRFSEAIQQWQQLATAHALPEFESQIRRLAALRGEKKKGAPIPAAKIMPMPSEVESVEPAVEPSESFSATRVLGSSVLPLKDMPQSPVPAIAEAAPDSPVIETAAPATSGTTARRLSAADVLRQLAHFVEQFKKYLVAGPVKYLVEAKKYLVETPKKYLAIGAAVTLVVLAAAGYVLFSGGKHTAKVKPQPPIQVHLVTNPADAVVTSGSEPVPNGIISLLPGSSATVLVARLGYKSKQVEVQRESDGNIALEPEPLHLSIQTSEKSGTVELDGKKIADLADGILDEYDFVPDGNSHTFSVKAHGKNLFAVQLQAVPGSPPQVNAFDAKGLFLITSLGSKAKLYAGNQVKNVRLGDQNIAVSPSGADLSLSEQNSEIKFGEGSEQGSVAIENSNAPILAVYSTNMGGQVQITSDVAKATLTVNGTPVKSQGHGWLVSKPPGTYTFELSADGYESQKWTMTLVSRQSLPSKKVKLTPRATPEVMVSLVIMHGTPEATVEADGKTIGKLDASGSLESPNVLTEGQHSIVLAKANFESREFPVTEKSQEVRLTDVKLTPWPKVAFQTTAPNVTVKYQRTGDSQAHQGPASEKLALQPGSYDFTAEAPGYREFSTKVNLPPGYDGSILLKLEPIPDYQYKDPTQIVHDGPDWLKSKDPHAFVQLRPGLLHETLIFPKPPHFLGWNKKIEWEVEASDNSARVNYVLDGQKMVRRLIIGEQTSDTKETKVDVTASNQATSLSVHIQVDGSRVQISNDKGVVLDDYTATQHNFSGGKIGIKTDSQFVVRDK